MRWPALLVVLVLVGVARAEPGTVIGIGGGRVPDAALDRLVAIAGSRTVVTCPAASAQVEGPEADRLRARGASSVVVVDFRSRDDAQDPGRARVLAAAGAIFFTGGDQGRLLATLARTAAHEAIRTAFARGAAIAGTSAGCAALGELAILGDSAPVVSGLALVPGAILDQHFLARRREGRLVRALLAYPGRVGIGVDERTAFAWRAGDREAEVLGESTVSVYVPRGERAFELRLVRPGERFVLRER